MFSSNPFVELSASIAPSVMQTYIIVMVILVAAGTIYDVLHKKSSALDFADDFDILMTEKDAVKLGRQLPDRYWYVPVDVEMDPQIAGPWLEQIESRMRSGSGDG